jgi:hypothetical protein
MSWIGSAEISGKRNQYGEKWHKEANRSVAALQRGLTNAFTLLKDQKELKDNETDMNHDLNHFGHGYLLLGQAEANSRRGSDIREERRRSQRKQNGAKTHGENP